MIDRWFICSGRLAVVQQDDLAMTQFEPELPL